MVVVAVVVLAKQNYPAGHQLVDKGIESDRSGIVEDMRGAPGGFGYQLCTGPVAGLLGWCLAAGNHEWEHARGDYAAKDSAQAGCLINKQVEKVSVYSWAHNLLLASSLVLMVLRTASSAVVVSHRFEIALDPAGANIVVTDHVEVPAALTGADGRVNFFLNRMFSPVADGLVLTRLAGDADRPDMSYFQLVPGESRTFTIRYSGRIANRHQLEAGHIGREGVYLSAAAGWYPRFGQALHRFTMTVDLPPGWQAVSQGGVVHGGSTSGSSNWVETRPQDEIYLIAAPWSVYTSVSPIAEAQVYLRSDDKALAERYLKATKTYLAFYEDLLGPYPHPKFALVENFWETGYGMPSFTLLGPRVVRLPFIIHTSYPHEILHNWWGNGVYVDYQDGNWSEGLTAYLADHLLRELAGLGADYRRDAMQKYRSYVTSAEEFPLRDFLGKHGESSQAIGYGKGLMFFHMLRHRLGDEDFLKGLRLFYAEHRFERAGYDELRAAFEQVSGQDLELIFFQWTQRTGAPVLVLDEVTTREIDTGFRVEGRVRQTQSGIPYSLDVPIVVQTVAQTREVSFRMETDVLEFALDLDVSPYRVHIDPGFDVFRQLDSSELPATLDEVMGARRAVAVVPGGIEQSRRLAYQRLAQSLGATYIVDDDSLVGLPQDEAVWLFGWENRFVPVMTSLLEAAGADLKPAHLDLASRRLDRDSTCIVVVVRHPTNQKPIASVGCDSEPTTDSLGHRLPHYGKYSFLGFDAESGRNLVKGNWRVTDSKMSARLRPNGNVPALVLPGRKKLSIFELDF